MKLEVIEQKCLSYLQQTTNPLVPVAVLLRHVREDPGLGEVGERDFVDFLSNHELFRVIQSMGWPGSHERGTEFADAGMTRGPYVILCTRVPSAEAMANAMDAELAKMEDALSKALGQAEGQGQTDRARILQEMLERARKLRKRTNKFR